MYCHAEIKKNNRTKQVYDEKKKKFACKSFPVVSAENHLKLIKVIPELNIFKPYFCSTGRNAPRKIR